MKPEQMISMIREYYGNCQIRFSDIMENSGISRSGEHGVDQNCLNYFKAWLILFLGMVEVTVESDMNVSSASYLSHYVLRRDTTPPYGPADREIADIVGALSDEELRSLFGTEFLREFRQLRRAADGTAGV